MAGRPEGGGRDRLLTPPRTCGATLPIKGRVKCQRLRSDTHPFSLRSKANSGMTKWKGRSAFYDRGFSFFGS